MQLFLDVAFNRLRTDFGAVNSALRVRGNAFGRAGAGELGTHTRFGVGDECDKFSVFSAADSNAALPAVVIPRHRSRFRICNIKRALFIDVNSTEPAELFPLR